MRGYLRAPIPRPLSFLTISRPRDIPVSCLGDLMETFLQDLKYAVRMLVKKPGFTLVAVLSLTLGIGANTTIFTIVKAVFMHVVPVSGPDRVITVFSSASSRGGTQQQFLPISYFNARDYREKNDVFS